MSPLATHFSVWLLLLFRAVVAKEQQPQVGPLVQA